MTVKQFKTNINDQELIIETGLMAKQADGAVTVRYGDTIVLVTAVMDKSPREGLNFLPLTVEYQERRYAAGKIPGGFFKREGRPSEKEILSARLIDRPIRPLFPKGLRNSLQIVATVLSSDGINNSDILALIGASTALSISNIPFNGPIGAVRVIYANGEYKAFPSFEETLESELDMIVAASDKGAVMIEGGAKQVSKEIVEKAIELSNSVNEKIIALQKEMISELGKQKREPELNIIPEDLLAKVSDLIKGKLEKQLELDTKEEKQAFIKSLKEELIAQLVTDENDVNEGDISEALHELEIKFVRDLAIESGKRSDGRGFEDVREISCQAGVLPRTHGSGLFTRGQTQSLAVITLGTASDGQKVDGLLEATTKSFMLHYNFPAFSVGEARPMRGPGRREIGHGALAEKALRVVMPSNDKFPYTVRIVSDILESNGSSSMASVCGSSLALMDAGVPIESPVAGIAIGLITKGDKYKILTDIAGLEDHCGDMDFKVAGTLKGITAIQVDLKIAGITKQMISEALEQSQKAREFILGKMAETISQAREDLSKYAPRITSLQIPPEKIGEVIGPSGKTIRKIIADTGVSIDINDEGKVLIASIDPDSSDKAIKCIQGLVEVPQIGKLYKGKITRIENFGAFVEILPNKNGLVHVSELSNEFVKSVSDAVSIGDVVVAKIVEIDNMGRVNLSIKQVSEDEKNSFKD
ncbi:MAG: polyribonucleotide nucleotidyltransferase [Candidatus Kappaea frigidicola]|nr:polyribonucleotide nucleotidyltransferase [Candidatus Kappaea frigidicola]